MLYFNNSHPEYAQNKYDGYILIKFLKEERLQEYLLNGKLYMKSPFDFHDEKMGEGRSDNFEGNVLVVYPTDDKYAAVKWFEKDGHAGFYVEEYDERPDDYSKNIFIYYPVRNKRKNVFCMYTLWLDTKTHNIAPINSEMLSQFGEYGVVVTNLKEFFNRIGIAVKNKTNIVEAKAGFVNYIPFEERDSIIYWTPFTKFLNGYDHQNEFRICIEKSYEGLLELDLGSSLRDIAAPIKTSDLIKEIKYNDGKVYFPIYTK